MADPLSPQSRPRILSGMRPTGKLHLGNYVGALQNWVKLQDAYQCFYFVADWHALTTDYDDTARVADNTLEVVLDYLAAGLDPEKCTIFVQSHVLQHAELHVLFSMITPLGWLERVPSYKEQQQNLSNKDLHMYGFLGYPLLQSADILLYRPRYVPVGEDQAAHVELTREVARRFNSFYNLKDKPIFPEPEALLTPAAKLLGMDKRKMSKSYGNSILLSDEAQVVEEKIKNSVTDRPKLTDHGSPDRCPVGNLHQIFSDRERLEYITQGCTEATIPCTECKTLAMQSVNAHLAPMRERRQELARHPERLHKIIQHGAEKAIAAAEETMLAVREAVGLLRIGAVEKLVMKDEGPGLLRVPESIANAQTDEERWELRTAGWLERLSTTYPLKKDRPRTFITRKGRKVGIYAAAENNGEWEFLVEDRPINVLVLLAEDGERLLHDYILPPKVIQDYWKKFSRSSEGVGIVLTKKANDTFIKVAGAEISIEQYKSNISALQ
jgi:tryptophanyl-tRNA synthetase